MKVIFPFYLSDGDGNTANGDNNGDDSDEKEIMVLLAKRPYITAKEVSMQTGFSTRKISRLMWNLRETGKIVRVGSSRKGYWEIKN